MQALVASGVTYLMCVLDLSEFRVLLCENINWKSRKTL